jgi:hypothetical protein
VLDQNGSPLAVANISVDVVLQGGVGATLGGTTTQVTDGTGVATFPGLSITGPGGGYTLEFQSGSLTSIGSSAIRLIAPAGLTVATEPSTSVRNDQPLARQSEIQLVDSSSNPVAISGVTVTAAIASGGGTLLGTLTATTNGSGLATFTDLRIQGLLGVRTLGFSASGLTGATSGTITVSAGTASALEMVAQPPATTVEGESFTATPSARLVDVSGNAVDSSAVGITVAPTPGGATLTGTTVQPTDATGVATFPGLGLTGTAGTYALDFNGPSLTGIQSSGVILLVPATIVIVIPPLGVGVSTVPLIPQPIVRVDGAAATPLSGVSVTVSLVIDAGAGTLLGTAVQVTDASGLASWTDLAIQSLAGAGTFRLRFTTANGTTTTTGQITIP